MNVAVLHPCTGISLRIRMSPSYDMDNLIQASTDPEEAQYAKTSVDYTVEERTRRVEKQRLFFAR